MADAHALVQTSDVRYAIAGYVNAVEFTGGCVVKFGVESGLAWTDSTANWVTLYRGATDTYWNFVRVRIWKPKTP